MCEQCPAFVCVCRNLRTFCILPDLKALFVFLKITSAEDLIYTFYNSVDIY
jgi:hypothetical protein